VTEEELAEIRATAAQLKAYPCNTVRNEVLLYRLQREFPRLLAEVERLQPIAVWFDRFTRDWWKRMTKEELDEIRARWEREMKDSWFFTSDDARLLLRKDIPNLLAEVERLREERTEQCT
jgi:hypothetical protein